MELHETMKMFRLMSVLNKQQKEEQRIRTKMLSIIEQSEYEEDDIPENYRVSMDVLHVLETAANMYTAIEKLDVEYLLIGDFKCFKIEDEWNGGQGIYFISSNEVLYLEDGEITDDNVI